MGGRVRIEGENLVLEVRGPDKILALKSSLTIPLDHVVSVSTERVGWTQYPGIRIGTNVPGLVKDGRYLTAEGWVFFEMHNPDSCITITLDHEAYKKVVFTVVDKESAAKLINKVIASSRPIQDNTAG